MRIFLSSSSIVVVGKVVKSKVHVMWLSIDSKVLLREVA